MNKERRKAIDAAIKLLEANRAAIDQLDFEVNNDIDQIKSDEDEYLNNMPEAMQNGEKGADTAEGIGCLERAFEAIEAIKDAVESFNLDDVLGELHSAKGA